MKPPVPGVLLHNEKGVWFWLSSGGVVELFYSNLKFHTELGALDPEEWQEEK